VSLSWLYLYQSFFFCLCFILFLVFVCVCVCVWGCVSSCVWLWCFLVFKNEVEFGKIWFCDSPSLKKNTKKRTLRYYLIRSPALLNYQRSLNLNPTNSEHEIGGGLGQKNEHMKLFRMYVSSRWGMDFRSNSTSSKPFIKNIFGHNKNFLKGYVPILRLFLIKWVTIQGIIRRCDQWSIKFNVSFIWLYFGKLLGNS
jgi:hypothetical protein